MTRLVVICDGETEADFCQRVLKPYLLGVGYSDVHPNLISKYQYDAIKRDVLRSLKQYERWTPVVASTMHDLYKLPLSFPDRKIAVLDRQNPTPYAERLESAYAADVDDSRFVPYVQLYEFETLLFADPTAFAGIFGNAERAIKRLKKVVAKFRSIELIDDGEPTSPSHRIAKEFPSYNKRLHGVEIARRIGLPKLRQKCPHFDGWLAHLEAAVRPA